MNWPCGKGMSGDSQLAFPFVLARNPEADLPAASLQDAVASAIEDSGGALQLVEYWQFCRRMDSLFVLREF